MIAVAVQPGGSFPLCKEPAATHAAGVCAAAIATCDLLASLRPLRDVAEVQHSDTVIERCFTAEALKQHLHGAQRLHRSFLALSLTFATWCLRELPGARRVSDDLRSISDDLLYRVIQPIRELERAIPDTTDAENPPARWSNRIKAIVAQKRRVLWQIVKPDGRLAKLEAQAESTLAALEQDWRLDVETIRRKIACRAERSTCPPRPETVKILLAPRKRKR